jgi:hypothetical protein
MKVARAYDAKFIDSVINHPQVRPYVGLPEGGVISLATLLRDRRNILLLGEGGGIFYHFIDDGIYEAHTQFLPENRGKYVVEFCLASVDWMFRNTEASELWTRVPHDNRPALALTIRCGGRYDRTEEGADFYKITLFDWMRK